MVLPTRFEADPRVVTVAPGQAIVVRGRTMGEDVPLHGVTSISFDTADLECAARDVLPTGAEIVCHAHEHAVGRNIVVACELDCGEAIPESATFVLRIVPQVTGPHVPTP